jgi:ADP-heptose:LPS heptosyltransferase
MSASSGAGRPYKTLVVRLSAVGDVVHTLPAAAALAEAGHAVIWAVQPGARPLVERNPAVAATIAIPAARSSSFRALAAARRALREAHATTALDLQGLWKSAAWALASGARRRIGFERGARREPSSAILLNELRPLPEGVRHVIDKNLALLAAVGVHRIGSREFPLPVFERERSRVARELSEIGEVGDRRPVLLHPGGGWGSKLWPAESYGELARRLGRAGLTTLVSWGPGEEALAERVAALSGGAARVAPAASLLELAAIAQASRLVVAADTGPLHLACAVGTAVVALFGPTDPDRNGPWSPADIVVSRQPPCFPCHRRDCPRHAGVMRSIPVDEVESAVGRRLAAA